MTTITITKEQFTETTDGLETVAYVAVRIPVGLIFDELPSEDELIRAALANFLDHPAVSSASDLQLYTDSITLEAPRTWRCAVCQDKQYLISTRDDGRKAVERCDACSKDILTDEAAAELAIVLDGVQCSKTYPCIISETK
jgi:hypothetical protein